MRQKQMTLVEGYCAVLGDRRDRIVKKITPVFAIGNNSTVIITDDLHASIDNIDKAVTIIN